MTESATGAAAFDESKSEAFAERFVGGLSEAALMLMYSVGHRTGLFDVLDDLGWATSQGIADAAELDERYVREWLGALVTGRVIDYRPEDKSYRLPAEHACWLTRRATPQNLAVTAQWIGVLGCVESPIVERFHAGGGLGYECYHRFHETMAEDSGQTVVAALQDHILPLDEGLAAKLEGGVRVLDVGCGSGRAVCRMAQAFPNSDFTGYDLCADAIEAARALADELGLTNARFEAKDITHLEDAGGFDLVTAFDIVHDQKDPAAVLDNIHAVLRPGGTFLMQDIAGSSYLEKNLDHPTGPFGYTISTMHCMSVSLSQDGAGLGTMWGEELAEEMLAAAGFSGTRKHKLSHDFINVYFVSRRD